MAKFTTTMRVKLDAKRRVMAGEVVDLTAEQAAPLLKAGAIEPYTRKPAPDKEAAEKGAAEKAAADKAAADKAAAEKANADAAAEAEAEAKRKQGEQG
jgi:membrane protein involved in colicin uptake